MDHHPRGDSKDQDAVTTADLARQAGLDRVAAWWPKGVERADEEPAEVTFARGAVGLVEEFSSPKDAGALVSAVHRFALWLVSTDGQLDPTQVFTPEVLATYRTEALADLPQGTQHATISRLRRVGAAVDADLVQATVACNRPTEPTAITEAQDRAQAAALDRTIETYAPEGLAPDRWGRVRPVVLEAVRAVQPATRQRAVVLLMRCAYLAAWVDSTDRALRRDVVFHPDTVEEFARALHEGMPRASAATTASTLRSISQALYPDLAPATWTHFGRRSARQDAYAPEELVAMAFQLTRERSAVRRRHLGGLMWLVLGTGARDGEQNLVRLPEDVRRDGDGTVTVTLTRPAGQSAGPGRHVVVLAPYADLLWEVVRDGLAHGDRWLLGGGSSRANRASNLCLETVGSWKPVLDVGRLRRTYLVSLMSAPHTVPELLAAAGVTTLAALDPLVELVVRSQQAPIDVEDADGEGADCEDGEDGEDGTVVAFAPEEFAALLGETPSPVGAANDPVAEAS